MFSFLDECGESRYYFRNKEEFALHHLGNKIYNHMSRIRFLATREPKRKPRFYGFYPKNSLEDKLIRKLYSGERIRIS